MILSSLLSVQLPISEKGSKPHFFKRKLYTWSSKEIQSTICTGGYHGTGRSGRMGKGGGSGRTYYTKSNSNIKVHFFAELQ